MRVGRRDLPHLLVSLQTEKKPRTSFAARGSSSAAEKLVIDLTSPKGAKKTVELEPVKPAAPKVTRIHC